MKLYDFSAYAKKRDEHRAARQIEELVPHLNEPGAVIKLKHHVEGWFVLHQEILRTANSK